MRRVYCKPYPTCHVIVKLRSVKLQTVGTHFAVDMAAASIASEASVCSGEDVVSDLVVEVCSTTGLYVKSIKECYTHLLLNEIPFIRNVVRDNVILVALVGRGVDFV